MAEETTPPVGEQPSTTPTSPFKDDGSLVDNWNTMAPEGYEELRDDKTLPRIKKFWDLGKSYVNVRRQVPLEKIARPTENFTDDDWNEWYRAGGRPDTPEDYAIKRPKDFPETHWDDNRSKEFQKLFHQIGLSKKQADKLVEFNNQEVMKALQAQEQQEEIEFQKLNDQLHAKWGAAYNEKVHLGDIAIEKGVNGDLDYKERLLDKINSDPDLIEFASNLGSLFVEHKIIERPTIPTPGDLQTQINNAMNDPSYLNASHPNHKRQVQLVAQLFKEKEKNSQVKTG
jgi:hypothetical protein